MGKIGRNERCPCGSGKKYKRCCLDQDTASERSAAGAPLVQGDAVDLIVGTAAGPMVRHVPPAMPPRLAREHGRAIEDATHGAATVWGLPDLVLRPAIRRLGNGTRELGDGILLTGAAGLVIQVKSRSSAGSDTEREARWLRKNAAKALRQGRGTARQLRRAPESMINGRGRGVTIDGSTLQWTFVAVIDHPQPPHGLMPVPDHELADAVVLLRRDWDFLFEQLKSVSAVAAYLQRVAGEPLQLGHEPIRYYELAQADARATPAGLDPRFLVGHAESVSEPALPLAPAATNDHDAHAMFRNILEDIARTELQSTTEDRRIQVLAELDRLPVMQRALIGGYLLDSFARVIDRPDLEGEAVEWHLRRVAGFGRTQLGFGVCNRFDDLIHAAFQAWTQLRHHEFAERLQFEGELGLTVAVLVTPRRDRVRVWDTTLCAVAGNLDLSRETLETYREVWRPEAEVAARPAPRIRS